MGKIAIIIGQSGTGKSVIVDYYKNHPVENWQVFDFDLGGYPKPDQKSVAELSVWVKAQREFWTREIQSVKYKDTNVALFGVAMYPWKTNLVGPNIYYAYLDCDQDLRKKRLTERGDPYLWEVYQDEILEINQKLDKLGAMKFDTTNLRVEEVASDIKIWLEAL